jgi:hypothetical protein
MLFSFNCYGHENILSTHRNTIEFTKDSELTKNGDCIVGVRADFDYDKLREFIKENKSKKIRCEIIVDDVKDWFSFLFNPGFSDKREMVIRKTDFKSERTLGVGVEKAAKDLKRELIEKIRSRNIKFGVIFRT